MKFIELKLIERYVMENEAEWIELASIDESEAYEVDINEIWYNPTKRIFLLRSASGCSCWDGDYDEREFDTLRQIEELLINDPDGYHYNPTLSGARTLLEEAYKAYNNLS